MKQLRAYMFRIIFLFVFSILQGAEQSSPLNHRSLIEIISHELITAEKKRIHWGGMNLTPQEVVEFCKKNPEHQICKNHLVLINEARTARLIGTMSELNDYIAEHILADKFHYMPMTDRITIGSQTYINTGVFTLGSNLYEQSIHKLITDMKLHYNNYEALLFCKKILGSLPKPRAEDQMTILEKNKQNEN
jgi:hypothetical protein